MRIIAGRLKGRTFDSPPGHRTHPMGDKIRGALFNVLGDVEGLTFLDAYAGSGACGFEALSRGASSVIAIDVDKGAKATITRNVKNLGAEQSLKAIHANASSWSEHNPADEFDVVILDPPYDEVKSAALEKLSRHAKIGGIVVFSLPPTNTLELPSSFELLVTKSYGDATLSFYRRLR